MERKQRHVTTKAAVVLAVIPILLWAYEYGPNPGYVGVPGENGGATCATAGCHTGTTNSAANKGGVAVTFSGGSSYVPGVKQRVTVTISDPAPTQGAWGFQLTARLATSTATMAGTFTPIDANSQLMCSQTNLQVFDEYCLPGAGKGCANPSSSPACPASLPLQYIEHSYTGYVQSLGGSSGTYSFDWNPPAANVGNVTVYVAGNAGVPGPPNQNGDHIYTTKYTLTPSAGSPSPVITGVSNSASGQAGVFPNAYVSLYGSGFAPAGTSDDWSKAIVNGKLPTTLDGVSVNIGNQSAYISYVSPSQVNVLVPDVGLGSMQVTLTTASGASAPVTVTSQQYSPAFFNLPGNQPVATHADYTLAVKNGTYSVTTVPARPGEAIILWGTGFGPTNPAAPVGTAVPTSPTLYTSTPVTATVGNVPASVYAAVLAPGFAGLYQVIVTVPSSLANGDYPVMVTVNGAQSNAWSLTVQQ